MATREKPKTTGKAPAKKATPKKNLGGRPTDCTPKATELYCAAIRDGLSFRSAAADADVDPSTVENWVAWGKEGKQPYAEFFRQREKAIADWERKRHFAMDDAGPQWTREAWRLERRLPDEYGKRERVDVNHGGQDGNPVRVTWWDGIAAATAKKRADAESDE